MYSGDIRLGDTIDVKFTTRSFSTGAPTTLAGSPVISAYIGNDTTQITAGITLSVDFDSVTGLHNVRVVATSGNGFTTATNVTLVITTGTVGGVSVVGEVIGSFSIECRSALMPTTPATLDVTATGAAGVDWGNVENKTTTNALTATTIAVTQKVDVDTIKTNAVVNGGTVTFPTNATLASTTNITAAAGIAVSSIGNNVITAGAIADGAIDTATFASGTTIPRCTLVDTITTYTGNTVQTGDSFARIGVAGVGLSNVVLPTGGLANVTAWTVAITGTVSGNATAAQGANLDVAVSSRMATYTQPTGFLAANFTTGIILSSAYDAAKTASQAGDAMTLTGAYGAAGHLGCNVLYVNSVQVNGAGTSADPWEPS